MNSYHLKIFSLNLLGCLVLLLCGCDGKKQTQALERFVEDTKKTSAQPIEPLPALKIADKFSYSAHNKRDPFSKVIERNYNGIRPDMNRPKEPLEAYSLDSLKMVGILTEQNKTWGIVMAPDNSVYRITLGSYLGQNFGRAKTIMPSEIKIVETIPQGEDWIQRETSLVLK
ncbi:MAG: pilus assembly protein PilP [Gammaproteobacteria bacterium]|jgi:type IV pilus assembly protein PilP|nr:pilus assembly protein PilP [Gammaproteobacteria bacterium]